MGDDTTDASMQLQDPLSQWHDTDSHLDATHLDAPHPDTPHLDDDDLLGILDNVPAGISVSTIRDGAPVSIMVNRRLAQYLGIASGKTAVAGLDQLLPYVHAKDRDGCRKALAGFLANRTKLDTICRIRLKGTDTFGWAHIEGWFAEQAGDTATVYLVFTDVSALKETEKTLQEATASAKLIVWEYDIPTHTIYLSDNEATDEERLRLDLKRVIPGVPESLVEVVDEQSVPALLEMYRKVEAGENASCDVWHKRRPGWEPHCERVSYTVECDEAGKAIRGYAVAADVTAEKNAEERYSREQSYLSDNRDFNLISKGHYNLTRNKVLEYSMQADKTPGGNYFTTYSDMSYDDAATALFHMPCPEEDHAALVDAVDRQHLLRRYQEGHFTSRAQYRRLRKGDLPLWMSVEMRTYTSPLTGDVECFSYTYDITDKVRNEEIMTHIVATEFDYVGLIFLQDETFELIQKSERISFPGIQVRVPYRARIDYVLSNFIAEDEVDLFRDAVLLDNILAGLETANRWSSTYHCIENDAIACKQLDFSWFDRSERVILAVRTDISASYERDQEQLAQMKAAKLKADRASEAKSSFLSTMSHDMRTPLNAVLGFTDLALKEDDPEAMRGYLQKVRYSGNLLLDLVNDTLELARIESGKRPVVPEAVASKDVGMSVIESLRPIAEAKGVKLVCGTFPDRYIYVDKLKIQKIWLNLLSNAIKYTPAGGTVRGAVEPIDPPIEGRNRRIVVEDTGIGMSEKFMAKMFEPFSQESRPEAEAGGTGLGLAIVKQLVDLLGGTISASSKPGEGTRFEVDLPIPSVNELTVARQQAQQTYEGLNGKRVLLCEDNPLNREIAVALLQSKGIETTCAEDGGTGLRMFIESPESAFDAILMDLRMPVMDGCEATEAIRALDRPDAKTVPIIAMTADAFTDDVQRCLDAGMNGHLAKPVDPDKLFRILAAAISGADER